MRILDNNSFKLARTCMDYTWKRMELISENVANVETPQYKSKSLDFESMFKQKFEALKNGKTVSRNEVAEVINAVNPSVNIKTNDSSRSDENNVEMDVENVEMARTQLQYQYLEVLVNDQFARLRTVINGR